MAGAMLEQANPPDNYVYVGSFPGLTVVCTPDATLDRPSQLHQRFWMRSGPVGVPARDAQRGGLVCLRDLVS